jgi:hypothetical protein
MVREGERRIAHELPSDRAHNPGGMLMARTSSHFGLFCMVAALLAGSLASCSSDLLNPVSHTWTLQTVGGVPLPATVPNSSPEIVITSGTGITSADGSYSFSFTGTSGGTDGEVGSDRGHWSITSSTFLFRSSNGVADYIGALGDASMRVSLDGQIVHSSDETIDMVFSETQ